jgi:DNA-binding Lrp family transcriptional regulator
MPMGGLLLIADPVLQLLADAGVVVVARAEPGQVDLLVPAVSGRRTLRVQVMTSARPVSATTLSTLARQPRPGDPALLVISPTLSSAARARAAELEISAVALNSALATGPDGHLATGAGLTIPLGRDSAEQPPALERARRWGAPNVVRTLILGGPQSQREIAAVAGVSQPRVSQVFRELENASLIRGRVAGSAWPPGSKTWVIPDFSALVSHWLRTYPGPGGVTTYWYGLSSPADQASAAVGALSDRAMISADVAADLLAPWARPHRAVVYARVGTDLSVAGLTPAPADQATLVLTVPADQGVWAYPTRSRSGIALADPLQVLWDLTQTDSPDTSQATAHLLAWLTTRLSAATSERVPAE